MTFFIFPDMIQTQITDIEQSLKAVASGGITGRGSGVDIPVPVKGESDFMFLCNF